MADVGAMLANYGNRGGLLNRLEKAKTERVVNRLNEFKLNELGQQQARGNQLRDLYGKAVGGDEAAMEGIAQVDPKFHMDLQTKLSALDDAGRARLAEEAGVKGRLAFSLQDDPNAWQQNFPNVPYEERSTFMARLGGLNESLFDTMNKEPSLKEIYDPKSPTGTRLVPPSQAAGQPGKPGSKTSLSVDPETGAVTFSQGSGMDMDAPPKGAQTQLFKDLVAGQQGMDSMRQIESLYEPEFLTYGGKAKGAAATILNKMDPESRSKFQSRRAAFLSAANREFFVFRKWATGVAGGEKEMAEIKRATFSEDDSPQDFESKLQLAKSLRRRLNARAKAAMKSGADNEIAFRDYIKANPLDQIPTLQERGDQLEKLGYSEDQVISILADEGYIEGSK